MITIKVNRKQKPQDILKATGFTMYTTDEIVNKMPKGKGKEVILDFFRLDKYVSEKELESEYKKRNLIPADPYSLATLAIENKDIFDEKKYIGTQWKDKKGYCFAAFGSNFGHRDVDVDRNDNVWDDHWWFAGLRKSSTKDSDTQTSTQTLSTLPDTLEINGIKYKKI